MSVWKRIDTWLERKAPKTLAALNPGATNESLAAFETKLGRKLPPSMRNAYAAHDGAIDDMAIAIFGALRAKPDHVWLRYMSWLPLDGVLEELKAMRDAGPWPENHIPIATDGGGNALVLDLESEAILIFDHETWDPQVVATSFEAWMTQLADDMEAKLVGTNEEDDEASIVLLEAPVPSVVTPSVGPDRAARVLLAALIERGWIEVAPGDLEPLVKDLHAALSILPPKARGRAVSNVLEKSKHVDEMFADDEQIADLVEEIG